MNTDLLLTDALKTLDTALEIVSVTSTLRNSVTRGSNLQKNIKKIRTSCSDFFNALPSNDPAKIRAYFTKLNRKLSNAIRASTQLIHQSGISKQLKLAADNIEKAMDNPVLRKPVAKAALWRDKLTKSVQHAASGMPLPLNLFYF